MVAERSRSTKGNRAVGLCGDFVGVGACDCELCGVESMEGEYRKSGECSEVGVGFSRFFTTFAATKKNK